MSDHWVVGGQVGAAVLCCGCFTTRAQFFAAAAGPAFTAFLLTQVSTVKDRRRRVVWYLALRSLHVAHERSEREVSGGVCLLEFYTE